MADKRIIELTNEAMNHSNDDYLAIDSSSSGTRKIKADALLAGVAKQADLAAETAAREQDVDDLKADLSEIITKSVVVSENIYNPELANTGYYWTDGHHDSGIYVNTGFVRVEGGKTYTLQTGLGYAAINRQIPSARFCVYYAEDKSTVIGSGSYVTNIVVPTEASYFIVSYNLTSVESFLSQYRIPFFFLQLLLFYLILPFPF